MKNTKPCHQKWPTPSHCEQLVDWASRVNVVCPLPRQEWLLSPPATSKMFSVQSAFHPWTENAPFLSLLTSHSSPLPASPGTLAACVMDCRLCSTAWSRAPKIVSRSSGEQNKTNKYPNHTRCSAIAERPRCRVRYSFRQK